MLNLSHKIKVNQRNSFAFGWRALLFKITKSGFSYNVEIPTVTMKIEVMKAKDDS